MSKPIEKSMLESSGNSDQEIIAPQQSGSSKIISLVKEYSGMIDQVLPANAPYSTNQIITLCSVVLRDKPEVMRCDERSIVGAVVTCAITGLDPFLQQVYFIPRNYMVYGNKVPRCELHISYMGWAKLISDTGLVKDTFSACVWQGEKFKVSLGTSRYIEHEPDMFAEHTEKNLICSYATADLRSGGNAMVVLPKARIEYLRSLNKASFSAWNDNLAEMAKAKAVRALRKEIPLVRSSPAYQADGKVVDIHAYRRDHTGIIDREQLEDDNRDDNTKPTESIEPESHELFPEGSDERDL